MFKTLTLIALILSSLMLFFSGCGTDEDEPLTSLDIPIHFAPSISGALAQGTYSARVRITGLGLSLPITRAVNLSPAPRDGALRNIPLNNIPTGVIGRNREITIEVLRNGVILFDGRTIMDISAGQANRVGIQLGSVIQREIVHGEWLLNDNTLVAFHPDGNVSETDGVNFSVGVYDIWGDRISLNILDFVGEGDVSIRGNIMTIAYDDGSVEVFERLIETF